MKKLILILLLIHAIISCSNLNREECADLRLHQFIERQKILKEFFKNCKLSRSECSKESIKILLKLRKEDDKILKERGC